MDSPQALARAKEMQDKLTAVSGAFAALSRAVVGDVTSMGRLKRPLHTPNHARGL